ncbi:hypothetical protein DFP72DRAFT_1042905 [Ephemerocybe angulata]|uniref:Uncharacterized protein n=1 Tax=Ephemerocybe angulata TaxID=980116 RepID=A0A8H6I6D9_9AGAR|nr:hypothetical protein DFP72DRAFT_1042905 [Tulosesus angulatus]
MMTIEGTGVFPILLSTKALLDRIGSATNPHHVEQINKRVPALEREIRALKSGQNMFSSINRLPGPEIMGMVFEFYHVDSSNWFCCSPWSCILHPVCTWVSSENQVVRCVQGRFRAKVIAARIGTDERPSTEELPI